MLCVVCSVCVVCSSSVRRPRVSTVVCAVECNVENGSRIQLNVLGQPKRLQKFPTTAVCWACGRGLDVVFNQQRHALGRTS